jgi:poly(hydroxyalkanoate) depolymerase family esterase
MASLDWRELFAQNQAAIRASGVSLPSLPSSIAEPGRLLPPPTHGPGGTLRPLERGATLPAVDAPGERRTFTVGGRARQALVHAPPGVGVETPAPLVCMLHGCTQDPESFAAATRIAAAAGRHGFVVVLPGQERGDNPMRCWNWFDPQQRARGRGEPAAIAGIVGQLLGEAEPRIDPRRVFVCGLSSGGAMASILAATYPDVFAAAAIHSGLAFGSASDVGSAYAAMANGGADPAGQGRAAHAAMGRHARAVPTIVVHGSADRTVAPVNADQVLQQTMTANRLAAPECRLLDERRPSTVSKGHADGGLAYSRARWHDTGGRLVHELLLVEGLGHAWSGGLPGGSYTDPRGPDATDAITRFFAEASGAQLERGEARAA